MTDNTQLLSDYLRKARAEREYSLRKLAAASGVPRTTIERIESGTLKHPRPDVLAQLADALEVDAADMYALAGIHVERRLPSLAPYLRTRYQGISDHAVTELEIYLSTVVEREGLALSTPAPEND